jgi:tRNA dimethylallyltransferase
LLAVDLARRYNGEIINGDAMQMYEGLPIITNKITVEEQQGVPHHLLGFIALNEEPWRVGLFKKKAGQIIREIRSRGRLPIVVGGTHYYTQSLLLDDSLVAEQSDSEEQVQSEFTNQEVAERYPILEGPTEAMIERLKEVDPVMAARWHPQDRRKIRRSLEIFLRTGKKASDIYAEQKKRKIIVEKKDAQEDLDSRPVAELASTLLFWVHAESNILKDRLDARVNKMMDAGLLKEVISMNEYMKTQESAGLSVDRTRGIWQSIGWKEFEPYLKALDSEMTSQTKFGRLCSSSIERVQIATRQYAKRQVRWIRLKLIHALSEHDALDRLYLVDGSDLSRWSENVSDPAIDISGQFLGGNELRPPQEMSPAALEFLSPPNPSDQPDVDFRQECELCHMTAVTEIQWQTHLKSRRHRGVVKRKQKNEIRGRSDDHKSDGTSALDTP